MDRPRVVFVLSGKRKSGKDFIAEKLQSLIGQEKCALIRLSAPLKYQYAQEHNLDYKLLLTSDGYKEHYRDDMIRWGESKRNSDPNFFCDLACDAGFGKPVWIVSDTRRPTDVAYFKRMKSRIVLVRIEAEEKVRRERGWKFVFGVDDCDSECALDNGIEWDYKIFNNGKVLDDALKKLLATTAVL